MRVVIIYGSPRKGITFEFAKIIKNEMKKYGDVDFDEVFLPDDAPCFCKGCFNCFSLGEDKCPDANYIQPIVGKMDGADGFIFTTPVYSLQISAALKSLFDHLSYCYLIHKPRFFDKKAMVISATAGAGVDSCLKYVKKNLKFWGLSKVFTVGKAVNAAYWQDIPQKLKDGAIFDLKKKAIKFYLEIKSKKIHNPTFMQTIMYYIGLGFSMGSEKANSDRVYWENNGWLKKGKKYYIDKVRPNFFGTLLGGILKSMLLKDIKKDKAI